MPSTDGPLTLLGGASRRRNESSGRAARGVSARAALGTDAPEVEGGGGKRGYDRPGLRVSRLKESGKPAAGIIGECQTHFDRTKISATLGRGRGALTGTGAGKPAACVESERPSALMQKEEKRGTVLDQPCRDEINSIEKDPASPHEVKLSR